VSRGGYPVSAEDAAPIGQAAAWLTDVYSDPSIGMIHLPIARQIARLCGNDSVMASTYEKLAEAVGAKVKRRGRGYFDRMGDPVPHSMSQTRDAVRRLCSRGWLHVTPGGARKPTVFRLVPGTPSRERQQVACRVRGCGMPGHTPTPVTGR